MKDVISSHTMIVKVKKQQEVCQWCSGREEGAMGQAFT